MKKKIFTVAFSGFLIINLLLIPVFAKAVEFGENNCGYEMMIVPVPGQEMTADVFDDPLIIDAWTTDDPFGNPFKEVYDFTVGEGNIAFVVEYFHTGGLLPRQFARGWTCGTDIVRKTCRFDWTIGPVPPGIYLLINFFDPNPYPPGEYDWAAKVGDLFFGWPNIDELRPLCFTVTE
jgi:hypothetical protein